VFYLYKLVLSVFLSCGNTWLYTIIQCSATYLQELISTRLLELFVLLHTSQNTYTVSFHQLKLLKPYSLTYEPSPNLTIALHCSKWLQRAMVAYIAIYRTSETLFQRQIPASVAELSSRPLS
jgi:hypothetical protein